MTTRHWNVVAEQMRGDLEYALEQLLDNHDIRIASRVASKGTRKRDETIKCPDDQ